MKSYIGTVRKIVLAGAVAMAAASASATVVFNSWTTNAGSPPANVEVTVTQVGSNFNWSLTIDPWNAEALGLFVDLGNTTIATATVSNVVTSPTAGGGISVFATDTSSGSCGAGCNLSGAPAEPLLTPDNEWELVFRLGTQGYEGIQTFSWTTNDFGLSEASFGLVAYRTQVNCPTGSTLPTSTDCEGSQKGFGYPDDGGGGSNEAPEPGSLALVGLALLGVGAARGRKA